MVSPTSQPMQFKFAVTITVHHQEVNATGDYTVTDSYELPGCAISISVGRTSRRSFEVETFDSDLIRGDCVLYAPPGADIRSSDRVTLPDGTEWSVWGYAADYASPFTGWRPGMQIRLRRFTG
jgi:hypothetical protein